MRRARVTKERQYSGDREHTVGTTRGKRTAKRHREKRS
jgi:hypothetical protein